MTHLRIMRRHTFINLIESLRVKVRDIGREMYGKQHATNRGPLGLSHLFSRECESETAAGGALLGLGDILGTGAGQKLAAFFPSSAAPNPGLWDNDLCAKAARIFKGGI